MTNPNPLQAVIIPVTAFQQNCTLLWCTRTMKGAFVDPGGDLARLKAAAAEHGVTAEKILVTHGHIDHCGSADRKRGVEGKGGAVRVEHGGSRNMTKKKNST